MSFADAETQILQALGGVVLLGVLWAIRYVAGILRIKLSDTQKAEIEDVAGKSIAYGLGRVEDIIKAKGWDHPDVKSGAVSLAINYAIERFPDAMKRAGIDATSIQTAARTLEPMLQRKFPEVAAVVAASPVTPPVGVPA